MKIVGLTGGIGSGKSTVLGFFKKLGAVVYIADIEAKKIMNSDEELKLEIINLFGENAYKDNVIDRKYLANVIFNDSQKLKKLNQIVHPKVKEHFINFTKQHLNEIIIYESAILFESGSNKYCDFIITVVADYDSKINRVKLRDGVSELEIKARMKHQTNDDFKINKSNFIINNTLLENTKSQVDTIFKILKSNIKE